MALGIKSSTVDLHMHSNASTDGEFTPERLVRKALQYGVHTLALCDHDTVRNVARTVACAVRSGITAIPAAEFSCDWNGYYLHILGYGIDVTDTRFELLTAQLEERLRESCIKRIDAVKALGMLVDETWVWGQAINGVYASERIAEAVFRDPRNSKHPLLQAFFPGGSRADNPVLNFAWDICEKGGPAYVATRYNEVSSVVSLIHSAGGVAVLAHPVCSFEKDLETAGFFLEQFLFDGLEVYSSYHDDNITAIYKKLAERMGLLLTMGSDFHGKTKPKLTPGCVSCEGREDELLAKLLARIKNYGGINIKILPEKGTI